MDRSAMTRYAAHLHRAEIRDGIPVLLGRTPARPRGPARIIIVPGG
jgi:hypothetical protein